MPSTLAVPLQAIFLAVFIHTLWGGNTVAAKFSLTTFPPLWTSFFRFLIGVACIALWAKYSGIKLWPERHEWYGLFLLGLLFTLQIGTMNFGIDHSTGAISTVLMATNPLFAALFTHWLIPGDRLNWLRSIGMIIAFIGTAVVLLQQQDASLISGSLHLFNIGNWILLLSATLLGWRLAFSARLLRHMDTARVVFWQMLFSLPLFVVSAGLFETIQWQNFGWQPVAGLLYQGIVIAGLGFMINSYLIKKYTPSVMVSFNFVSPISGVLLSVWLLNELLTWNLVIGVITVGLGLYLIARKS